MTPDVVRWFLGKGCQVNDRCVSWSRSNRSSHSNPSALEALFGYEEYVNAEVVEILLENGSVLTLSTQFCLPSDLFFFLSGGIRPRVIQSAVSLKNGIAILEKLLHYGARLNEGIQPFSIRASFPRLHAPLIPGCMAIAVDSIIARLHPLDSDDEGGIDEEAMINDMLMLRARRHPEVEEVPPEVEISRRHMPPLEKMQVEKEKEKEKEKEEEENEKSAEEKKEEKDYELLLWLIKKKCPWDRGCFNAAIEGGFSLNILKKMIENDCPWTRQSIKIAEANQRHDVAQWLRDLLP